MAVLSFVLSIALMAPFLAWGIYTLRERYLLHHEIPRATEIKTVVGLILFLSAQLILLRVWIGSVEVFYAFALLGLLAASTALYGPVIISVLSQTIVDALHPVQEVCESEPHFGPAEALEGECDYDGALREYMVLARIYPKHAEPAFRVATVLWELERFKEAADSFERGIRLCSDPERALFATNRLADLYTHKLDASDRAIQILEAYLDRYPEAGRQDLIQRRIKRLHNNAAQPALEPDANEA
jgi:tetratricopeptide (TPR) repeat protein